VNESSAVNQCASGCGAAGATALRMNGASAAATMNASMIRKKASA
jgi:hypothetical protein